MVPVSPPPIRQRGRRAGLRAAVVTMSCAVLGVGALPGTSTAVPDAACPSSLRSVAGGAPDPLVGSRDDGAPGPGARYEPGQLLVQLRPGVSAGAFACVRRELGAALLDGGPGKLGFAGLPGLMLVQLPPNRSVDATVRLLRSARYGSLVAAAEPNGVLAEEEAPNDPLWGLQWGLGTGNRVPDEPVDDAGQSVARDPAAILTDARFVSTPESMRLEQAWAATHRTFRSFRRYVQVAVLDNSLEQHPDLEQNASESWSRRIEPLDFQRQSFVVSDPDRVFAIRTGAGDETCTIDGLVPLATLTSIVKRRTSVLCDHTGPNVHAYVLTVDATAGTFRLTDGNGGSVPISIDQLRAYSPSYLLHESLLAQMKAGAAPNAFATLIARASPALDIRYLRPDTTCADLRVCTRFVIAIDSSRTPLGLEPPEAGITRTVDGRTSRGHVQLEELTAVGSDGAPAAPERIQVGLAGGPPLSGALTSSPAGALHDITVRGNYTAVVAENPKWPGRAAGSASDHGQMIAGLIGATSNNELGISGVTGPNTKLKLAGIVAPLTQSALLEGIHYAGATMHAKVVNVSIGSPLPAGQAPAALDDPSREDPRPVDLLQKAMAQHPGTLFVLAAGNEATNLLDPALRDRHRYRGHAAGYGHCAPKGMGESTYWRNRANAERSVDKGGSLSQLRMPDGTFDRGNILCVAALAPAPAPGAGQLAARRLANFSNWGRDIVDVAAPGDQVIGTTFDGKYKVGGGTSYAAPLVAGVAAMVFWMHPKMDPSVVKCAILSSATSAPLDAPDMTAFPFRDYGPGVGQPLTVNGMVVATEALSAADALAGRRAKATWHLVGPYTPPQATCVQRRAERTWNAEAQQWVPGGAWVNATSEDLNALSPAPPAPAPDPKPAAGP